MSIKINAHQREAIRRSQESMAWWLRSFGKVKHPSAGILPFHPFSYQRKAIKSFRKYRLNIFRKCFAKGSMVWTIIGPKPIESVVVGDIIYSYNEKTGALETDTVTAAQFTGERETVVVRTKTGHRSICTPDHRFLTRRGWVEAANLTTNDIIIEVNEPQRYKDINESDAILLGYLVTDGCYSGETKTQFSFTNTSWKYLLEYQKHFELKFQKRLKIKLHARAGEGKSKKNSYRLLSSHAPAKKWLVDLGMWGKKAKDKHLPDIVFTWDNRSIAVLINRLFAGDGWYGGTHCNEVGIGSESLLLLNQIKQLLSRFQIDAKIYPATETSLAKLRIFGTDNFTRFVDQIRIYAKEQRHIPTTKGFSRNRIKGQVKSVQPGHTTAVYDLEIKKNHNFIVDGAVVHNCRQAGVSKIAGAFALWFAMFQPHKTILIVSRTDLDAMKFLAEHILFLFNSLPQWMQDVWKVPGLKWNEHEISFSNGSRIQSLTSHPDVLRSNASSLNIIDEAGFIQNMDMLWSGGWPCVRYDTLIQTDNGLIKVGELANGGNPWKNHQIKVATDEGYCDSNQAYVSGRKPTTIIDTQLGFQIEGTNHHRLRVVDEIGDYVWKRLDEIVPGDTLVSIPGQFEGKRKTLDNGVELGPDLAEFLGLYIGDGWIHKSDHRVKICFDPQDKATRDLIVEKFNHLEFGLNTKAYAESSFDTEDFRVNSVKFAQMLKRNGLASKSKAQDAEIPSAILKSDKDVLCAFLRGLFDSDGWCYPSSTCLKLGVSTTSVRLAEQVQIALHSLGIISRRYLVETEKIPNKNNQRYSDEPYWRVDVWDAASKIRYRELIGFITKRKQKALDDFLGSDEFADITNPVLVYEFANAAIKKLMGDGTFRQCSDARKWNLYRIRRLGTVRLVLVRQLSKELGLTDRLSRYINKGFFFDSVAMVSKGETETFDISVPKNNTYLANGIISHNTLQHGGNVIVISTTNGVGNWYWSTMTDAEAGVNSFNPVRINWWDMDWEIEYRDPLSREDRRIAPLDNIVETKGQTIRHPKHGEVRLDPVKYGPYWSPWLEDQYRALQEQGEAWKFEQEVLAKFVGSGNTVLSKEVLIHIQTTAREPLYKVNDLQTYVHPVTGRTEELDFNFRDASEGLWIWEKPIIATPIKRRGTIIIDQGQPARSYVMGVDIATGKGHDYSAIEIFDIGTRTQVAEFMARCLPREFVRYIDRIGRWYNCALAIVERNNGGDTLIDSLRHDVMYPRMWRKKDINDKPRPMHSRLRQRPMKVAPYGFTTTAASKPTLNKFIIDFIRGNADEGYTIYSKRLLKQFNTYVRKRDRSGRDTMKTEAEDGAGNFDDLVMACGLALIGTADAFMLDAGNLIPMGAKDDFKSQQGPKILTDPTKIDLQEAFAARGGPGLLMPMALAPVELPETSAQRQIDSYTLSLGGVPISQGRSLVTPKRYYYSRE